MLVNYCSVLPDKVSFYTRNEGEGISAKCPVSNSLKNLENNDHEGKISTPANNKIRTAVNWLLYLADEKKAYNKKKGKYFKFKISFITLTLSAKQAHTDNEIKSKLLNQFLIELRAKFHVKNYIWRAEPQRNGNLHFHIICDKFIHYEDLRNVWNRIQNKFYYVDNFSANQRKKFAAGFVFDKAKKGYWSKTQQLKAYKKGLENSFSDPNSTDIHSVRKIRNLPAYLSKYISKNTEVRKIEGRLWGLSESLSKLRNSVSVIDSSLDKDVNFLFDFFKEKIRNYDYVTTIYVSIAEWEGYKLPTLYNNVLNYLKENYLKVA